MSDGTSSKITSKVVFSSTASCAAPPPATGAARKPPPTGVDASTPKVYSICETNSAASNKVIDFNFSIISLVVVDIMSPCNLFKLNRF